jgi:ABC-2 type transport system permease protein
MMVFDAFYRSAASSVPMTHEQTITYIWLGQGMILLALFGVDKDIAQMIRSGSVAYELTRPLDLYSLWFARALSGRATPLVMRAIPIFAVAMLFLGLQPPATIAHGVIFVIAAVGALLLASSIIVLLTVLLLWTISGEGINRLVPALIFFCSGIAVPLPLFPDWLQSVIAVLPFRALMDTPFRLYMGHLSGAAAVSAMVHQWTWLVVFVLAGRTILARGLRRLVVQGG